MFLEINWNLVRRVCAVHIPKEDHAGQVFKYQNKLHQRSLVRFELSTTRLGVLKFRVDRCIKIECKISIFEETFYSGREIENLKLFYGDNWATENTIDTNM